MEDSRILLSLTVLTALVGELLDRRQLDRDSFISRLTTAQTAFAMKGRQQDVAALREYIATISAS